MKTYDQIVRSVYGEARTPFWSGFSHALGLFSASGKPTPRRRLRSEADALTQDWSKVSRDLQRAMERAGCR